MNITEIANALDHMVKDMTDKGVVTPNAELTIRAGGRPFARLTSAYAAKTFDGYYYKFFHGDTPEEALNAARNCIAAMPSLDESVTREYLTRVASAVDYATENSISDEYVTPLRGVTCAMTDNLLTSAKEQTS